MKSLNNSLLSFFKHFHAISTLLLLAVLPVFFNAVTRWALVLFFVSFILDYIFNKRYTEQPFWSWQKLPFVCCIGLFLLLCIYYPLEETTAFWGFIAERRFALIGFGIVGLLGFRPRLKNQYVALPFMLVSLVLILWVGIQTCIWISTYQPQVTLGKFFQIFSSIRHTYVHAHMAFNIYLIAGVIGSLWIWKHTTKIGVKIGTAFLAVLFYICVTFSDGRIGMIGIHFLLAVCLISLLVKSKKRTVKYWLIIGLPVGILLLSFLLVKTPKWKQLTNSTQDIRVEIWKESGKIIQEKPLLGWGASTSAAKLVEAFHQNEQINKNTFLLSHANEKDILGAHPHNQLLQSWMEFGVIGLLVTIVLLISPYFLLYKRKGSWLVLAFWTVIVLQVQTEVIHTSIDEFAFCLYLLLVMNLPFMYEPREKEHRKEVPSCSQRSLD